MRKQEFKEVLKLATTGTDFPAYLSQEMESVFGGMALDSRRRTATRRQVASLIRGHCLTLAGTWDFSEIYDIEAMAKRIDLAD